MSFERKRQNDGVTITLGCEFDAVIEIEKACACTGRNG
jgi:hypothetical protein